MHIKQQPDLFYLSYKNKDNVFIPLNRNSISSLNGFQRNFDANEATSGGSLFIDLHFYGTRELETIKAWTSNDAEKAPLDAKFARVSYVKNKDISYALLVFDFSESFVKNFEESLVYYDTENKSLLDSLKIKISVGAVNQEAFNLESAVISSDYISLNSIEERIGILFIDKADVQQYVANNATISGIKYLIYNYLPKSVNNQYEFIPIRLELVLASEDLNKLPEKEIGNEFPINKIEEIFQIYKLQVQEFSNIQSSEVSEYSKKMLYLNNIKMPITSWEFSQYDNYFEIENYLHNLQFNTLFSYSKLYYKNNLYYDFFKYGNHVFELKADPANKDALPKTIRLLNNWTGGESSLLYMDYYENRSLDKIFWEITGFFKHIVWLFNEENSYLENKVILRKVYLKKLRTILLNMLFEKPNTENVIEYYQREDIYRNFYGSFYNYSEYSGEQLNNSEIFLLQMTVRNFLYLVDVLWYKNLDQEFNAIYENFRFYQHIDEYLFDNLNYYNDKKFKKLNILSSDELGKNINILNSYLLSVYQFYFTKEYLFIDKSNDFGKNLIPFDVFVETNRKIALEINNYINFLNIFSPNRPTEFLELPENTTYWSYGLCLALLEEILNSPLVLNSLRFTSNYQFWHIIEKDFVLNSKKIGDSRFIVKEMIDFTSLASTLNNIDIISTMVYGFIDSITTTSGSTISLKAKILTNI